MPFSKWLVPDSLPEEKADTICCLSYGLSWDKTRLANQGLSCVLLAIGLHREKKAPVIIFSNAYKQYWQAEANHKNKVAEEMKVPPSAIIHLEAVEHTYD